MKHTLLIVLAILISLPVLGSLLLHIIFSGGIGGVISNLMPAPDPKDQRISELRNTVVSDISASFDVVDTLEGVTPYATSTHDECYKGTSNYKRTDGYAYRCSYRMTKFYGFNTEFLPFAFDLEQKLFSSGWKLPYEDSKSMKQLMDEYYGNPGKDLVSDLPTPSYEKGTYGKDLKSLYVEYEERAARTLFQLEYAQSVDNDSYDEIYDVRNFQDIPALFSKITSENQYILYVSIQRHYFEN